MPFELFYIYASDRSYGLDWIWVSIYVIIVDWIGLGHRVNGLDWIGFRKLDPCPTLNVSIYTVGNYYSTVCVTDLGRGCTGCRKRCFQHRRKPRTSARRSRRGSAVVGLERRRLGTRTDPNCRWSAAAVRRSVRLSNCLPSQLPSPRGPSDRPASAELRLSQHNHIFPAMTVLLGANTLRSKLSYVSNFRGSNGPYCIILRLNFQKNRNGDPLLRRSGLPKYVCN